MLVHSVRRVPSPKAFSSDRILKPVVLKHIGRVGLRHRRYIRVKVYTGEATSRRDWLFLIWCSVSIARSRPIRTRPGNGSMGKT
jgi:hypothetical protein